jgi:hypothetical protein
LVVITRVVARAAHVARSYSIVFALNTECRLFRGLDAFAIAFLRQDAASRAVVLGEVHGASGREFFHGGEVLTREATLLAMTELRTRRAGL